MKHYGRLATIAILACASRAWSGVVLTSDIVDFKPKPGGAAAPTKPPLRQDRSFLDGDRLRVEMHDGVLIFRGDRDLVWMLRSAERSYVEIDRESMKQMREKLKAVRAQLKGQLDKIPPEQRAQVEQMLAAQDLEDAPVASPSPDTRRIVATGKTEKVGDFACREVDVLRGTEKVTDR